MRLPSLAAAAERTVVHILHELGRPGERHVDPPRPGGTSCLDRLLNQAANEFHAISALSVKLAAQAASTRGQAM
jgi:hypothetical protein